MRVWRWRRKRVLRETQRQTETKRVRLVSYYWAVNSNN